jgi:hypothetical protein
MGNILWRRFGQEVFLIALHKPEWCGPPPNATSLFCAPFDGVIDCAAAAPAGFDILGSPIAQLLFPAKSFYALNHPMLRLIDYADGYIWTRPVDEAALVEIIPLEEWATELTTKERAAWEKWKLDLECPLQRRPSWAQLAKWRETCQMSRGMSR